MKKRKKRLGDRKDGYKLHDLDPITRLTPFIMRERNDALNFFTDSLEITEAEKYIREKRAAGYENFGLLHVIIASYVRTVSQRPALNRFISGQQLYHRNFIEVAMTIKKEMTLNSEETCIKVRFDPASTAVEVYDKFNQAVEEYKNTNNESNFDGLTKVVKALPRFMIRSFIAFLRWTDYHGIMPKSIIELSPFHASCYITSMGSLGIPPVFHHIYNFGNVPIFIAFGKRRRENELQADGSIKNKLYSDISVVTDERICDGFYFASAFKYMQRLIRDPYKLDTPPEEVLDDID